MAIFRNISGLVVLLIFTSNAYAQKELHFDESGFQSVMQRAKAAHKPVFYMIYASWCSHCNNMKQTVFKDSTVTNYFNKNFVCAWQDLEKGEGKMFRDKYHVNAFPTFIFFDENENVLYNINGEFKAADLIAEAKIAMTPEKQIPYLQKQFYDDPSNSDKCLAFLVTMKKGYERYVLNPHAQHYFETQSDAQLVSANNWRILANGVSDIQSRPFQYVLKHQEEFAKVSSAKRVQKKIVNIVTELLEPYVAATDTTNYFKKRAVAESIHLQKTDSVIFRYDMQIAERAKNWTAYKKVTLPSVEKYVWNDSKALIEIAKNYALHVADISSMKYAILWAQHALERNDTYDGEIVLAKLYQKNKDLKSAAASAQKAKDKNVALGFNTKEADELLANLGVK
jgi:thioredoxin-related protein